MRFGRQVDNIILELNRLSILPLGTDYSQARGIYDCLNFLDIPCDFDFANLTLRALRFRHHFERPYSNRLLFPLPDNDARLGFQFQVMGRIA